MSKDNTVQFDYFYGNEAEQFTFYRIPKVLVTSPQFKRVSDSAKLLYGLMLDRMGLSIKNGWVDENNRAYIFFTTKDVMEQMCCGTEKAIKILAELDSEKGIGLIERKKQGQGKPAIVYLKKFIITEHKSRVSEIENQDFGKSKSQTFGNQNSRVSETESADFRESKCNNNKYNNTDLSNINPSYPSVEVERNSELTVQIQERWIDRYNQNIELIKQNIEYDALCQTYDSKIVMNCVHIMAEILTVDTDYYTIEGKKYPARLIQLRIKEVDFAVLDSFLLHFERRTDKIHNMKSYLITSLFNAVSTAASQIHNTVAYDMYGQYRE